ncbi:MAG TPA: helix-turn-helix domain-containing protein [Rickettsia endosymbiont of Pyrocoelia pectoralis]|nr:helix-turn-helix domain-containing protein [Rickettsia endosymbiont of Pyrocoelia pectoralis]
MRKSTNQINKFTSERLKQQRITVGLSHKELGAVINVNAVQMKKYEEGVSAIPVSRLYVLAKALNMPLKHFFNNAEEDKSELEYKPDQEDKSIANEVGYLIKEIEEYRLDNVAEESEKYEAEIPFDRKELSRTVEREILSLTRAFSKIQNPNLRKIIIELIRSLAADCK